MRAARARKDTLLASRREDKALRGCNLSAHPEAGHAEEAQGGFFAPGMFGPKAKNPKASGAGSLLSRTDRPIARLAASPITMYAPWL